MPTILGHQWLTGRSVRLSAPDLVKTSVSGGAEVAFASPCPYTAFSMNTLSGSSAYPPNGPRRVKPQAA